MKNIGLLVLVGCFLSNNAHAWGAPDLAKSDIRQKKYDVVTTLDKKSAYVKLLIWASKSFNDSNSAIKMKDADLGVIVAKGNIPCDALKLGNGFGKDQTISFDLEMTATDKKIEIKVEDLIGKSSNAYDTASRPSDAKEADKAFKDCVDPLVEKIKDSLK